LIEGSVNKEELAEKKSDDYELVEYITVEINPTQSETIEKETDESPVKQTFGLPLINAVYNEWLEKNLKKHNQKPETSKTLFMQSGEETIKFEIEEYEIIQPESNKIKPNVKQSIDYKTIKFETKGLKTVEKETDKRPAKQIFDIPIINQVHNDWLEKKQKE